MNTTSIILSILAGCVLLVSPLNANPDTIALKKMVVEISTEKDHVEFWEYIHYRDQELRRSNEILIIDQENLILVSFYFNRFGYPESAQLGRKCTILNFVWVHTLSYEAKRIAFPIILKGYISGEIKEKDLRDYYLRPMYHRSFGDKMHLTKPLDTLFRELRLSVGSKINMPLLVQQLESYNQLIAFEKDVLGNWRAANRRDTFSVNGNPFIKETQGQEAMLFKTPDNRMYFTNIYSNNIPDPVEVIYLEEKEKGFKEKNKVTTRYYRITSEGDLDYVLENGRVKFRYYKI